MSIGVTVTAVFTAALNSTAQVNVIELPAVTVPLGSLVSITVGVGTARNTCHITRYSNNSKLKRTCQSHIFHAALNNIDITQQTTADSDFTGVLASVRELERTKGENGYICNFSLRVCSGP